MNPYTVLATGVDTTEAASLRARLTAWHDAMVAHERRLRAGTTSDRCGDECPHAEARLLWSEVLAMFGPRAAELTFLRSRAMSGSRRSTVGAGPDTRSDNGGTAHAATADGSPAIASARTRAAEL